MRILIMVAALMFFWPVASPAATLFVMSVGPSGVDVLVNGNGRKLGVGQRSPEGVVLVSIDKGMAIFDDGGKRIGLGMGQSTTVESSMRSDAGGGFATTALVNGVPFRGQIDTGATYVALNVVDAQRAGIDFRRGRPIQVHTANGTTRAYLLTAASVQVGAVTLNNVEVAVSEGGAAQLNTVLIGQSFLRHVDLRQAGGTLTISKPQY